MLDYQHLLLYASILFGDQLRLCKEQQIVSSARFGVRAGHVESAKRMRANQSTSAFPVKIQIASKNSRLASSRCARFREMTAPVKP